MSVQTRYGYSTPIGAAGGIVDLAPHAIDTFLNEEKSGVLRFGMGVVQGSNPGTNIALPDDKATAAVFEGITTNNRTTEYDMEGKLHVRSGVAVGVMRYGKIYGRVAEGAEPAYGDTVYLITSGDEAGCFTNEAPATAAAVESDAEAGKTEDAADTAPGVIAIKARFIGGVDKSAKIAAIELFNQAQA